MKKESEKSENKNTEEKLNNDQIKRSAEDGEKAERKIKKLKKDKKPKKDKSLNETVEENNESIESTEVNLDENVKEITKKKPSKRQMKKEKAAIRAAEVKKASKQESAVNALNYVSQWKHAKSQWKFNKVKQIWLIDNLLNDNYVPDEHFPIILEYFEGCKGAARKLLIDKGMAAIKEAEEAVEKDEEIIETIKYKRARQLVQALPTET